MTKEVMISIRGMQFLEDEEDDEIETIQQGNYYEKNGSRYLLFEEYMEGFREPVKNVIRFTEDEMSLTKRGPIHVQLSFLKGKKNLSSYQTPYGTMMIGVDTSKVQMTETPEEILLKIGYTLEANYQFVADCQISIDIRAKGTEGFDIFDEELGETETEYTS